MVLHALGVRRGAVRPVVTEGRYETFCLAADLDRSFGTGIALDQDRDR